METSTTAKDYEMTTEYDYGDTTPCQKVQERAFGAQLLPPLYSVVFVVGLIGNILVVLVLMQYKRLRSMTSIYLLNLAISDLIFLFTLPFWIDYKVKDDWVFCEAMCKLLSGLFFMGLYSEIFFIMLLTIHRTVLLSRISSHLRVRTPTFRVITTSVTWVLAILASVPGFYFSKTQSWFTHYTCSLHFPPESFRRWRQFLALKLNILGLILPLLVMIICYRPIIKILFRRRDKRAKAIMRLIFVIMIAFFLFWTPYNLTVFVSAFQDSLCEHCSQLDLAIEVTEVIAYAHCCVNPIVCLFPWKVPQGSMGLALSADYMSLLHPQGDRRGFTPCPFHRQERKLFCGPSRTQQLSPAKMLTGEEATWVSQPDSDS